MNLRVLKKSRRKPLPGDIFVVGVPGGKYAFGRVIRVDATIGPLVNCILIYIYKGLYSRKTPPPELTPRALLVPPLLTNRQGWLRGYFETVEHRPLAADQVLPTHCFASYVSRDTYYDEYGNRLSEPIEPLGEHELQSYRTIDDQISAALGIPLSGRQSATRKLKRMCKSCFPHPPRSTLRSFPREQDGGQ
jgi:hypothetical protein